MAQINQGSFIDSKQYPSLYKIWNAFNKNNTCIQTVWKVTLCVTPIFILLVAYDVAFGRKLFSMHVEAEERKRDVEAEARKRDVEAEEKKEVIEANIKRKKEEAEIRASFLIAKNSLQPSAPIMAAYKKVITDKSFSSMEEFKVFQDILIKLIFVEEKPDSRFERLSNQFIRIILPALYDHFERLDGSCLKIKKINEFFTAIKFSLQKYLIEGQKEEIFKRLQEEQKEKIGIAFQEELQFVENFFKNEDKKLEFGQVLSRINDNLEILEILQYINMKLQMQGNFTVNFIKYMSKKINDDLFVFSEEHLNQISNLCLCPSSYEMLKATIRINNFIKIEGITVGDFITLLQCLYDDINRLSKEQLEKNPFKNGLMGLVRQGMLRLISFVENKGLQIDFSQEEGTLQRNIIIAFLSKDNGIPGLINMDTIVLTMNMNTDGDAALALAMQE